jgi:hypothetical protein
MKYILIILLVILILIFIEKKSIEYKKEKLEETCDYNCGKNKSEGSCLSCKNCGVCKLVDGNRINTYCLPGDKNGALFNEQCKGNAWNFRGDYNTDNVKSEIVLTREPRKYNVSSTSYTDILKEMGQNIEIKNEVYDSTKQIGQTIVSEESEKKIELKSYNDVLTELETLSNFFK